MAQKKQLEKNTTKAEQILAREQRQELRDELTENFAQRPRMPGNRRRVITFSALGVIALLAIIFTTLVLWPASAQQPHGGVAVGVPAPTFMLPIAGGQGNGTISLQSLPRGDISTFGQTFHVNYPLLFDPGSAVNIAYGVTSLPMTYFIDSNGIVRFVAPQQLTPELMQRGLAAIGITIP